MDAFKKIVEKFPEVKNVELIKPLTAGLINQTYLVKTEGTATDYILQCINHNIFKDVDMLQDRKSVV